MAYFSLQSETHSVKSNTNDLFDYMSDFNHFKHLLPTDKIENFECTSEQCSFSIKGLTTLTIKIKDASRSSATNPNSKITFETLGLAKFVFTLHIHLVANQTTHVQMEGDLNPFIKVMAEKPLLELINTMALKLSQIEI